MEFKHKSDGWLTADVRKIVVQCESVNRRAMVKHGGRQDVRAIPCVPGISIGIMIMTEARYLRASLYSSIEPIHLARSNLLHDRKIGFNRNYQRVVRDIIHGLGMSVYHLQSEGTVGKLTTLSLIPQSFLVDLSAERNFRNLEIRF